MTDPGKREKKEAKKRKIKDTPDAEWEDTPFKKKENAVLTKLNMFVDNSFKELGLDPSKDSLNKN
jgi:hypothetical protein